MSDGMVTRATPRAWEAPVLRPLTRRSTESSPDMGPPVDVRRAAASLGTSRSAAGDAVRMDGVRLALFTDTFGPQLNGVTRTLHRLVVAARDRGAAVEVFTTSDPAATPADGVHRAPSIPFWGYPQLRLAAPGGGRLARALRDWRASLVHVATPFGMGLAGRHAAHLAGIPLVSSYHTHFTAYASYYQLGALRGAGWHYLRWFHNGTRRTYCPTAAVARELEARGFQRTAVWGRGVDTTDFAPGWRSMEMRRSLGLRDSELVVAFVGRVAREKGLDDLIDAMRLLRQLPDAPPCRLLIVGDGPDLDGCRARAGDGVIFTGRREGEDLSRLYASADLFVFPSTTDTFGNVMLEAMASALPVIVADTVVARELLARGAGSFYPPGQPRELAAHIARWGRDPALRCAAGRAGVSAAADRSWARVFDALFADYRTARDVRVNAA